MPGRKARSMQERFWEQVKKESFARVPELGPCWIYGRADGVARYGVITKDDGSKSNVTAHRYSYELHKGPLERGKYACHRCDVKRCVNPDHLYAGDHEDNNEDNRKRGLFVAPKVRSARVKTVRGEASHGRKLGQEYVERLKAEYASGKFTQMELARRYGVSQGTVSATIRGFKNMGAGKPAGEKRSGFFRRKLAPEVIQQIRSLYAEGQHTQQQLAERFGCDQTYVSLIVRGKA